MQNRITALRVEPTLPWESLYSKRSPEWLAEITFPTFTVGSAFHQTPLTTASTSPNPSWVRPV